MKTIDVLRAISILTLSVSTPNGAGAAELPTVVKTYSGACRRSDRTLIGSGTLFKSGQEVYVLTSEHAVVHAPGDARYCHEVRDESHVRYPAELAAVDWGTGLALLRLKSASAALKNHSIQDIAEFSAQAETAPNGEVTSLGYPQRLDTLDSSTGRILTQKGNRHLIPFLDRTIETVDVHGEFGMSGGALVDAAGSFAGVISHQYFTLSMGQASPVREFSMGREDLQNYLVVIPAPEAWAWAKQTITRGSDFTPTFLRDPEEQLGLKSSESVISENLRFELDTPPPVNSLAMQGGGHGSGVTGLARKDQSTIKVSVVRSRSNTHFALGANEGWFRGVQSKALSGAELAVETFFPVRSKSAEAVHFGSLAEFARDLADSRLMPLTIGGGAESGKLPKAFQAASAILKSWLGSATIRAKSLSSKDAQEADALLRELGLLESVLEAGDPSAVQPAWLDELIQSRSSAWSAFMSGDSEMQEVVSVITALREVRSSLAP